VQQQQQQQLIERRRVASSLHQTGQHLDANTLRQTTSTTTTVTFCYAFILCFCLKTRLLHNDFLVADGRLDVNI